MGRALALGSFGCESNVRFRSSIAGCLVVCEWRSRNLIMKVPLSGWAAPYSVRIREQPSLCQHFCLRGNRLQAGAVDARSRQVRSDTIRPMDR